MGLRSGTALGCSLLLAIALAGCARFTAPATGGPSARPSAGPTPVAPAASDGATAPAPTTTWATPSSETSAGISLWRLPGFAEMPGHDGRVTAREFLGVDVPEGELPCTDADAAPGDIRAFWLLDMLPAGPPAPRQISATLAWRSPRVQMWVDHSLTVDGGALAAAGGWIDTHLYAEMFGSGSAGLLKCPLAIIHADLVGSEGYYASANEYPCAVDPYSAERPAVYIDPLAASPDTIPYRATLAHELTHLAQFQADANEDSWVKEGEAQLAEERMGRARTDRAAAYLVSPDLQLNAMPVQIGALWPHYGAAYLWVRYADQRLGNGAWGELLHEPADGMAGFEAVLQRRLPGFTLAELFGDFVAANALQDPGLAEGQYAHAGLALPRMACEQISAPYAADHTVNQFGVDCYALAVQSRADVVVTVQMSPTVLLASGNPPTDREMWWSNRGDRGHSWLETAVDLSQTTMSPVLSYDAWYDIEEGWDYAYLRLSADEGASWHLIATPLMTADNPSGNALGAGYTGRSGGAVSGEGAASWVHEDVPLGDWAGQQVRLRFDYITDDAATGTGLCLADLRLSGPRPPGGAAGDISWMSHGFVRTSGRLPQQGMLYVLSPGNAKPVLQRVLLKDGRPMTIIVPSAQAAGAIVTVSGLTPYTLQPAAYTLAVSPLLR